MIRLEGLTPLQVQIADLIWNCESQDDVELLIRSMPNEEYRRTATVMMQMIVVAAIDEVVDDPETDYKAARKILSRFQQPRE
jgi:hypothetical protein